LARTRKWSKRINLAWSLRFHLTEGSESIPSQSNGETLLIFIYLNLKWMTMIWTELSKPKVLWHKALGLTLLLWVF
jgi:hypothetical protein